MTRYIHILGRGLAVPSAQASKSEAATVARAELEENPSHPVSFVNDFTPCNLSVTHPYFITTHLTTSNIATNVCVERLVDISQ
jgi:hypothetical protein